MFEILSRLNRNDAAKPVGASLLATPHTLSSEQARWITSWVSSSTCSNPTGTEACGYSIHESISPTRPSPASSALDSLLPKTRIRVSLFIAIAALSLGETFAAATVEGKVTLPKNHTAPVMSKRYEIVTQGGILSTNPPLAVVYLDGAFPLPAATTAPQIIQKDMAFSPALLPVQAGTRVEFPNLDSTYHNIFSYSPAKRFDLGRYRPAERPIPSVLFDQPGLVVLRCDIHEHMRGLVLVLGGPHFVLTNAEGEYRLEGLPDGHYVLKVWLNSQTTLERTVELKDGVTLKVDFP